MLRCESFAGVCSSVFFFFQAEDGIRDWSVTGVQTCALPIFFRLVLLPIAAIGLGSTASAQWTATSLHPVGAAWSSAIATTASHQVGMAGVGGGGESGGGGRRGGRGGGGGGNE